MMLQPTLKNHVSILTRCHGFKDTHKKSMVFLEQNQMWHIRRETMANEG